MSMPKPRPTSAALSAVFEPNAIAVYGASSDPNKIGGRPLRYLKELGFNGSLYAINPARESVQGVRSFPSATAIDGELDLAVIAVPAESVLGALQDCVRKGVKGAVVLSSGFSEIGSKGAQMQAEITALAGASGMRILGPNCLGFVNGVRGISVTFSPSRELRWPQLGSIGFVTQSGAFGSHSAAVCCNRGLGLGMWITTGNEADIDIADCIFFLAGDSHTTVIAGYIEGCRDAPKLAAALDHARLNGKQVILLKAGTSDAGVAAVASHTAVLAGRDELFDAFLRQHGVIRARSVDDLLDTAYACAPGIRPASPRTAIISTSGGVGVIMADAAIEAGLRVDPLPTEVQDKIRAMLPYAGTRNPIDTTAQMVNDITLVSKCFEYVIAGSATDIIVTHLSFIGYDIALMDELSGPLFALRRKHPEKLFVLSMLCSENIRRCYEAAGFLVFEDPTRAVQAAVKCNTAAAFAREAFARVDVANTGVMPTMKSGPATEHEAKQVLRAAGIPVPAEAVVDSAEAAVAKARSIGFPVVLKVVARDIPHKTEVGGVLLNLSTPEAVAAGYHELHARVGAAAPHAHIEGILVGRQIVGGIETIAGILNDPVLGPFVMLGLGGIFTEVFNDVVFRRAPFGIEQAGKMIRELRSFSVLDGARGQPRADLAALADVLCRLSRLAAANVGTIQSMDINPLIACPEGVYAVDAMVVSLSDSALEKRA